jgi:hypothetical protein
MGKSVRAHPLKASWGPDRRSQIRAILDVALLGLRLPKCCSLGLNHNLPFLDGHPLSEIDYKMHTTIR